jgi:hypothetical protein
MYKQHANSAAHSISAHISPLAVRVQFRILRPRHSQLRISRSGCQEHEAGSRAPSIDQGSVSDSLCQRPAKPRARLSTMRQIIDSRAVRPVITRAVPGHRQNRPCRQLQRTDVVHVILRHVRRSFLPICQHDAISSNWNVKRLFAHASCPVQPARSRGCDVENKR